jgi:hypothetical protein
VNASTTLTPTVTIRRGQLIGLIATVALLAAVVAWAVSTYGFDPDATSVSKNAAWVAVPASTGVPPSGFLDGIEHARAAK